MADHLTPIRSILNMRDLTRQRSEAVDAMVEAEEWAAASRVWSRQSEALLLAAVAEPPTNAEDALAVLTCLAEMRDQRGDGGNLSPFRAVDLAEMTTVAVQNCVVALAGNLVPKEDYTEAEVRSVEWSAKQVARWLPTPIELTDDERVSDIQFDALAAPGEITSFFQNGLQSKVSGLKLAMMLATFDRRGLVTYLGDLDKDERADVVETAQAIGKWVGQIGKLVEAAAARSLIALAELGEMLKPTEETEV
jgi:hypothetical protein